MRFFGPLPRESWPEPPNGPLFPTRQSYGHWSKARIWVPDARSGLGWGCVTSEGWEQSGGSRGLCFLPWFLLRDYPPSCGSLWMSQPLSFSFLCIFIFLLSRAAPAAYGGSQARDPIRAAAAGLPHSHSNARSQLRFRPTPQLTATPDP